MLEKLGIFSIFLKKDFTKLLSCYLKIKTKQKKKTAYHVLMYKIYFSNWHELTQWYNFATHPTITGSSKAVPSNATVT